MRFEHEILINKYGQDLIDLDQLVLLYKSFGEDYKRSFIHGLITLIMQSKPKKEDIKIAICNSCLKESYTPCVLLKKDLSQSNLYKFGGLPSYELEKTVVLFLNLFRVAYKRRFEKERNNIYKWWYWDLSDSRNLKRIEDGKLTMD